jgi:hypothetical protein
MALLAHLIDGFKDGHENMATKALYHVVTSHVMARNVLTAMAASIGHPVPPDLRFQLQQRDPQYGQPDLIGVDDKGRAVLVIEAKFWAGLTEHQPVSYIKLLPEERSGIVLFLAPAERISALTAQLAYRCQMAGYQTTTGADDSSFSIGTHGLGVISWATLLHRMLDVARSKGDDGAVSDIHQLLCLCEHIENASFIPFKPEEISSLETPRRMLDLSRILSGLADAGVAHGIWTHGRVGSADCQVYYKIWIGPLMAWLQFSASLWRELKLSPFWISTNTSWGEHRGLPADAAARLQAALAYPGQKSVHKENGDVFIALDVKPGTAEEELVTDLLGQARTLVQRLQGSGLFALGGGAESNPEVGDVDPD